MPDCIVSRAYVNGLFVDGSLDGFSSGKMLEHVEQHHSFNDGADGFEC